MAFQYGVAIRNARLNVFNGQANPVVAQGGIVGNAALLRIYSGAEPADCGTAASGTLLCEITLPSNWLAAASGGQVAKNGAWSGTGAAGAGAGTNAGYFRIYDSGGTTCHIQGNITATGGGGDATLDNINIAQNQTVTFSSFQITAANA